ncbi:hypothetical protein NHQ30_006543 [Ciborinia camelliae]|nr:hypothetical protein NHQ30_006543 [Ciborinia camelliae]
MPLHLTTKLCQSRSRCMQRLWSSSSIIIRGHHTFSPVPTIDGSFENVDLDLFRQEAFTPEKPVVMRAMKDGSSTSSDKEMSIEVADKWFVPVSSTQFAKAVSPDATNTSMPSRYLHNFAKEIFPYELTIESADARDQLEWFMRNTERHISFSWLLRQVLEPYDSKKRFYHFYAPLFLFLFAARPNCPLPFYIAQAQIADLPEKLQQDLPTPQVVKNAGQGDIYGASIWMGTSISYTPLHKDPNPNLFVQLVGKKRVRLFSPFIGREIYQKVQQSIGASGTASMRGEEMMEGPEKPLLEERVWGEGVADEGLEVEVGPGDALFIPKGWWHSIKSSERGITASANWWFR